MKLFDVNVLVNAFREDAAHHVPCREYLENTIADPSAFALTPVVLSGFIRVTTHKRIFKTPTPLADSLDFTNALLAHPHATVVRPGQRQWGIFTRLLTQVSATGNLVPDAYIASVAIESGCEVVSTDGDFAHFPGLRWTDPRAV